MSRNKLKYFNVPWLQQWWKKKPNFLSAENRAIIPYKPFTNKQSKVNDLDLKPDKGKGDLKCHPKSTN